MSQQQPPYIGSKISLVSKLDIRYEGILYSVDAVEATIALAKVHSFGTEDRRTPVFVPPREEMYQFIVFKANDIKDLLVCETAKSANSVSHELPYDPAIVSISKNPPPEPKLPTKLNLNGPAHIRGAQHQLTQPFMGASDVTHHQQFTYRNNNNNGGNRPLRELRSNRPSLREDHNQAFFFQPPHQQQPHNIHQRMPPARIESVPLPFGDNRSPKPRIKFDSDYDFEEANKKFLEQIILDLGEKTEKVKISPEKAVEAEQESAAEKENGKTIDTTSEGEEKLAPKGVAADENVTAIAADEQPNDGIEKGGSKDENTADAKGTQEGEESEQLFYDKSASFFDNISCDASERESGYNMRPDWKHMRQTNTETFGQAAVRSLLHQYQQQRRGAMAMFGGGGPYMMGAAGPARSGGGGGRPKAGGYQRTQHQQVVGYRHQN